MNRSLFMTEIYVVLCTIWYHSYTCAHGTKSRNATHPVRNAQYVRFSARVCFMTVSVLVGENLYIPAVCIKITFKTSFAIWELWKCYDIDGRWFCLVRSGSNFYFFFMKKTFELICFIWYLFMPLRLKTVENEYFLIG